MATIDNFPNNVDEYRDCKPVMKWLHGRTSGVFGATEELAVTSNDNMTVSVSDGYAWLSNDKGDGCVVWNDTEENSGSKLTLDVGLADPSLPRYVRVVVSWDTVDYSAKPTIDILQGNPAGNPEPPAITNNTLKRQISIAKILVAAAATKITAADITDERLDPEVCGLVTDQVGIDTSVMQAQFTALLELVRAELERLNAGTEAMLKTTYDTDRRGRNIFGDIPYLYKATFDMDAWEGSGKVSQTATLTAVDGGGPVTANSILLPEMGTESNLPAEAKDAMQSAAAAIAKATKTLGADTITVELGSAPDVDVELYFLIKKGDGESVHPPLNPVGAGAGKSLLWTNPTPEAAFNPQDIELNLSGYSFLYIEFLPYGSQYEQWAGRSINVFPVGYTGNLSFAFLNQGAGPTSASLEAVNRLFNSDVSGVHFKNGVAVVAGAKSAMANTWVIPTKIWGER